MKSVAAHLSFDGNCRDGMNYYRDILGGSLNVHAYPDENGEASDDPAARVMHSAIELDGRPLLMASDTPMPGTLTAGTSTAVAVDCESEEEARRIYAGLSEGGEVIVPLDRAPWGAIFAMLTDRYGFRWLINCADDESV